ncbi:MAG: hypothetical protein FJW23_08125 [Acidimicrobiia bacterium]|nr:hypothetical protein [Acidimicrobiia bacterium]
MARRRQDLLLLGASALAVGVAEGLLRLVDRPRPILSGWRYVDLPGAHPEGANELGYWAVGSGAAR